MSEETKNEDIRIYYRVESCIFKKNNDEFGGLSNMATKFPIIVNNVPIKTTEALYQACRFPHLPDIQKKIIEQKSPMTVKMVSKAHRNVSRADWNTVRLKIMKWCINIKLAQNFMTFGELLHSTGQKNIVENSQIDNFWGAIPNEDETIFTGKNALGRLLMELRQTYFSKECYSLLYIEPPKIEDFDFLGQPISIIDERSTFLEWLLNYWKSKPQNNYNIHFTLNEVNAIKKNGCSETKYNRNDDSIPKKNPRKRNNTTKRKKDTEIMLAPQASLFED